MRSWWWLVAVACTACGDNTRVEGDSIEPRSGTRLALQSWRFATGARQLADAFFDRLLDSSCTAEEWSDGLIYCTPATGSTFFLDPGCTREVGRIEAEARPIDFFARSFVLDGETRTSRLFRAVRPAAAPGALFLLRGDTCEPTELPVAASYFELEEVPRDALVHLVITDVPLDERLAARVVTSDDGLRLPTTLVDRRFDVPCRIEPGQRQGDCRPHEATHASYFHDVACSRPELSVPRDAPLPDLAVALDRGCPRYFERGEQVPATPLHRLEGQTCTATAGSVEEHYFLLGAPVELARAPRTVRTGGRLSELETFGVPDPYLFDRVLGTECTALEVAGTTRCVPHHVLAERVGLHHQPDCRDAPTFVAIVPETPCGPLPAIAARFEITRLAGLYHLGSPARMYTPTAGGCVEYLAPGFHVRPVSEPIPFESLVPATLAIDAAQ